MSTATDKPEKKREMPLRQLVTLMLLDLEIYEDENVTPTNVKAYGWPQKYIGMTYKEALLDCTRVLLFGVLAHHCPSTKG